MRVSFVMCLAVALAAVVYLTVDLGRVGAWAVDAQRGFQDQMALAVRALKSGEAGALATLLGATAAYGFVHALGPGHGKYLLGGVGVGTEISARRLVGLAILSSLAQSLWAVILVYGGFLLLEVSAHQVIGLAENVLAPASYLAIAGVGLLVAWRGLRTARRVDSKAHAHSHADGECGCHAHGPTPDEVAQVVSARDAAALVLSIAIRPCTGAIFLLVIAWQMDLHLAGALAVLTMGLGTAALTSAVSVSGVAVRSAALASAKSLDSWRVAGPVLQVFAGVTITLLGLGLAGFVV